MKQAGSEEPGGEATPAGPPTPQMGTPSTVRRAPSTKHNKNTGAVLGAETQARELRLPGRQPPNPAGPAVSVIKCLTLAKLTSLAIKNRESKMKLTGNKPNQS